MRPPSTPVTEQAALFNGVLGRLLRQRRRARGWSQRDLCERVTTSVSESVLGACEQGTQSMTVVQLLHVCDELGADAGALVSAAFAAAYPRHPVSPRTWLRFVDLARTDKPALQRLRGWATAQLRAAPAPHRPTAGLYLSGPTVNAMATVCGLPVDELHEQLRGLVATS